MKRINSVAELRQNISTLEMYLSKRHEPEFSFALERIKRGTCFVAVLNADGYHFYPSRFIGYTANTMDKHLNNTEKDGRLTNPAISNLLGSEPVFTEDLEKAYRQYCDLLGFSPNERGAFGVTRKYWQL